MENNCFNSPKFDFDDDDTLIFPSELFKYECENETNKDYSSIEELNNNELWVSQQNSQNDPVSFPFSLNKQKINEKLNLNDEDLEHYLSTFLNNLDYGSAVLSFGTSWDNQTLWSYYSKGFQGYVIEYKKEDVDYALSHYSFKTGNNSDVKEKLCDNFASESVTYSDEKTDETDFFINWFKGLRQETYQFASPFMKQGFWEKEKEYRYSLGKPFEVEMEENSGFKINNLSPASIYIGFKCKEEEEKRLLQIAKEKKIPCFRCRPKFFTSENLVEKIKYNID
jgi:hypothetical protein